MLSREEGKTLPEGIGEVARAGQIFEFFAGEALRHGGRHARLRAPRRRRRGHARAGRRRRPDHALELPDRDPGLEDRAGARLRQLRRAQAGRPGAGHRPGARRDHRPRPACRPACSTSSWVAARWSARRSSSHKDVDAISFTGSVATGRKIAAEPASPPTPMKKVQLEMGGKNPMVVLDDADLKIAVEAAVNGAFFSTGPALHRLLAPDRHRGHPRRLRRGDDRAAEGPRRRRRAEGRHRISARWSTRASSTRTCDYIEIGKDEGAKLAFGGELLKRDDARLLPRSPRCSPTSTTRMRIAREEIFGPVAAVLRVKDYDEALGGRQRHRVRPVRRHLHDLPEARRRTSSATSRPAW